ncbi:MAG: cyclase family protein [Agathobacter sp.]|nr:cyclase family protein [Agathobacter sp.]
MKLYDISQEIFTCQIYEGDPGPKQIIINDMEQDDLYNLSAFSMCSHNGTHVDAPKHFLQNGKTIDEIPLEHFVGKAYVSEHHGLITAEDAFGILVKANGEDAAKRILIKGDAVVTIEAAEVFANAGILLLGNESQTIGPEDAPMAVHLLLLKADVVLFEGIRLAEVPEGVYLLNAVPLNLGGLEGAPCRAILIEE